MNESILSALVGLIVGALISWVLAQSRQRQALAKTAAADLALSTQLQVEQLTGVHFWQSNDSNWPIAAKLFSIDKRRLIMRDDGLAFE